MMVVVSYESVGGFIIDAISFANFSGRRFISIQGCSFARFLTNFSVAYLKINENQ